MYSLATMHTSQMDGQTDDITMPTA